MTQVEQLTLGFKHTPSFSINDFLIGTANKTAFSWLDSWPNWPNQILTISGPKGSGKTHLSHLFIARSNAKIINLNLIKILDVRPLIKEHKAIVLDDVDTCINDKTEEVLFHLLNIIKEMDGSAMLLSSSPPARWSLQLPDLKSRLRAMLHVSILLPDDELLRSLIFKLFRDRQLKVQSNIVDYILSRSDRSYQSIRDIIEKIDKLALESHRNITIPLIKDILEDL